MQKEFVVRILKIQEEFHQWKDISCSVFLGMLPSLKWQAKLRVSSMLLEQSNIVAPVIIRITGVSEKMKSNETFQSPAFYTHCFGYRVCLLVKLNGVYECEGAQVSIAISVLSGENDEKLNWPLEGEFTVSLLNHIRNNNHHFLTLQKSMETITMPSSFTTRYVCEDFICHRESLTVSSVRKFIVHDIIYMQVHYLEQK